MVAPEFQAEVRTLIDQMDLGLPVDQLSTRPLPGGASNENFLLEAPDRRRWVFRLAAPLRLSERFALDRWHGSTAHRHAQAAGVAPDLVGIVLPSGHSLVEFIDGQTLDPASIREGRSLEDAVLALQRVHRGEMWGCGTFNGWTEVSRFMTVAAEETLRLPADIDELVGLSRDIEQVYQDVAFPDVLCHNDVQIANLIRESSGRVWIVDWEYAGVGNVYFDLAMVVNNADLNRDETGRVLDAYFGERRDADYARIELSRYQSSMREALWSIVAEPVLETGWDYQAWANQFFDAARAARHRIERDDLLKMSGPAPDDQRHIERLMKND